MYKWLATFFVFWINIAFVFSQAEDFKKVNPTLTEFGLGYSHSNLTNGTDAYFNIGFQKSINRHFFVGFLLSPQYRHNARLDLVIGSKIRLGKYVSKDKNISLGLGYSLYSKRHKSLPGLAFDLNFDKTNAYGFHLKYEEFNSEMWTHEKNIILGLHLKSRKAVKIGLPIIGGVSAVMGIFLAIISQSK